MTAAAVTVVVLPVLRHAAAAPVATVVGSGAAALVTPAHVLPHWSGLSNSYIDDVTVDALSWAVVLLEIVTAIALGCAGTARLSAAARQGAVLHG